VFAIGHFGLGYLLGKVSSKITHTPLNFALLFTVSIIPDLDLLFPSFLAHRGPTHSLLFSVLVSLPFIIVYRKRAIPYFVALLSHSLIGDIYSSTMGVRLFWPFSNNWIRVFTLANTSTLSVSLELTLFAISTIVMVWNQDLKKILTYDESTFYWLISLGSVLGPLLFSQINSDYSIPFLLIFPSLFYVAIFSIAIIRPYISIKNKLHEE